VCSLLEFADSQNHEQGRRAVDQDERQSIHGTFETRHRTSGNVRSVEPEDSSEWMNPRLGYVATHPNVLEVHYIVRFSW
jgi:hypothetical protein